MTIGVLNKETLNYYGGFYEIEESPKTNSISFLKKIVDKLTVRTLEKGEELGIILDDAIGTLTSRKVKKDVDFDEQIALIGSLISSLEQFRAILRKFDIDDSFALKILESNDQLIEKSNILKNLLLEYKEVKEAREEIKSGKTLTLDELLDGL